MWVPPSDSTSRNRPEWTARALSCRRKLIQEGGFDTRIFFWVVVLSILLRLVLLLPRHSYLGNRYWLGWGMGWSQRKRCWVVGVCRGAAAGQGWPMPRFVWILGGCWVGAKTTTGLTDTAWMGLSCCRERLSQSSCCLMVSNSAVRGPSSRLLHTRAVVRHT